MTEVAIIAPERHCSNITPKYFTVFFASIAVPFQVILKPDCDINLDLDPNSIASVLPKCRESLLSASHSLTISSSFCTICSILDTHISATKIAESSAYNKSLLLTVVVIVVLFYLHNDVKGYQTYFNVFGSDVTQF